MSYHFGSKDLGQYDPNQTFSFDPETPMSAYAKSTEPAVMGPALPPSMQPPVDTGVSGQAVGSVLTGIGAVLNPLAQVGVGIFSAQQQMDLQKARMKMEKKRSMIPTYMPGPRVAVKGSNTTVVVAAVVGGLVITGLLIFVLSK
jgi:hypothetical protein